MKRLLSALLVFFLATVIFFSCWYLASSRDHLIQWYYSLNNCFYKSSQWPTNFFTVKVKAAGNWYCIAAIILAIAGMTFFLRYWKRRSTTASAKWTLRLSGIDLLQGALVIVAAIALWLWANSLAAPSNDEVFSALNCASLHPLQTISYYMLPNNHVFFNTLNNIFFHAAGNKAFTARIISLIFYCCLLLGMLALLRTLISNKWLALLATLTMATQFPIWGFGCQGRGYELLALCEWTTLLSFLKYRPGNNRHWLYLMAAAVSIAYFTIPIFMYFHMAVLLFAILLQLAARKIDSRFWFMQACCGAVVFMLYLPALSFSGLQAITANPWLSITQSYDQLWKDLTDTCHEFMDYTFCNIGRGNYYPDLVLFLLPLTLFLYKKNKTAQLFGIFYCCMWGVLVLFTLKMKVYPMDRALPGQFSVTLALVIYALYLGLTTLLARMSSRLLPFILAAILVWMNINYIEKDQKHITHYQCHFPVNMWHDLLSEGIDTSIPRGSTVAFSDESFYFYFLCKKMGYPVTQCAGGGEQYVIKLTSESFPVPGGRNYVAVKTVGDYSIYKRK